MADEFHKVEKCYRGSVQKNTMDQTWLGESASAAHTNFAATRYECQAAQIQAKATVLLLRNARQQFVDLKKQLESARRRRQGRDERLRAGERDVRLGPAHRR
ncbi:hypothetical protein [Streptomyces sp. NPDC059743]|uniref:hypothetical protein n=1 Tax=Streptomyces sp. NPDC059743 TaxID=3346928 RepID=UPI00364A6BC7